MFRFPSFEFSDLTGLNFESSEFRSMLLSMSSTSLSNMSHSNPEWRGDLNKKKTAYLMTLSLGKPSKKP